MKVLAALSAIITASSASCLYGTSLLPRAADGTVPVSTFNYTAEGGPLNWYGLNTTANSACAKGSFQSPIDIMTSTIGYATKGSVTINIPAVRSAEFENLGSTLEVVANGTLVANGTTYKLAQFHFHTPSEHRVNEEYFPMESHFVFQTSSTQALFILFLIFYFILLVFVLAHLLTAAKDKSIAVVAFLLELSPYGFTTPLFDSVFAHLDDISTAGTYTETGPLDFSGITEHLDSHGIYDYSGSLTTPPCSQGVSWYISTEPLPINVQTYHAVKKVLKFNARYTQNTLGQPNLLEVSATELGTSGASL
jgi:carbonic anhydrase